MTEPTPIPHWSRDCLVILEGCATDALESGLRLIQAIRAVEARLLDSHPEAEARSEEIEALRRATEHLLVHASAAFTLLH
jgi:hypothetical protein